MAVPWASPELATRYAPYVEELRDFFAQQHLHCGSPEDLVALTGLLEASESFREDLTSMVRVILLREGGSVPRADLLEIVIVAIGGAGVDEASFDIQQPVQHIFNFLNGVLCKPWNQPPGEVRVESQAPPPVAAPQAVARSEDQPSEDQPKAESVAMVAPEAAPATGTEVSEATPAEAFVRPEWVFSRLTDIESGTQTPPSQSPALAAPDAEPAIASESLLPPEPIPDAPLTPPSTLDAEPPPPPGVFPAMHLPKLSVPLISSQVRIGLISGVGATLFVAALMYAAAHRSANAVLETTAQPLTTPSQIEVPSPGPNNSPPAAEAPATPVAPAASIPTPSAAPAKAHPRHVGRRDRDDYIAPPYSTPIPAELRVPVSHTPNGSAPTGPNPASVAAASPERTDASPPPVRHLTVSPSEMAGDLLSAPPPSYPMLAKIAHVQGQVVVQAVVDRDGSVSAAYVLSGHHLLRSAAVDAVLRRRYRPHLVDGHPVEVSTTITLDFSQR